MHAHEQNGLPHPIAEQSDAASAATPIIPTERHSELSTSQDAGCVTEDAPPRFTPTVEAEIYQAYIDSPEGRHQWEEHAATSHEDLTRYANTLRQICDGLPGSTDKLDLLNALDKLTGEINKIVREDRHKLRARLGDIETRLRSQLETGTPKPAKSIAAEKETKEERQARRYQLCIEAGLDMPTDEYAHLPRGVNAVARKEGITRQAFAEDVKAHISRLREQQVSGK